MPLEGRRALCSAGGRRRRSRPEPLQDARRSFDRASDTGRSGSRARRRACSVGALACIEVLVTVLLGLDPGFASVGLVGLDVDADRVVRFDVFRTSKDDRKGRTLAVEDNVRRAREIASWLSRAVVELEPIAIAAEAMSFPRSSSVAAKVALTWGIIATLAERHELAIVQATPQEVKRSLCGRKDAAKDDVADELRRRWPELEVLEEAIPRSQREHPFDALAAAAVALTSDVVRLGRRAAAGVGFTGHGARETFRH